MHWHRFSHLFYSKGVLEPEPKNSLHPTWAFCCEIPESGLGKKWGRDVCPERCSWISEGRPDLEPRVGERLNPVIFPLSNKACERSAFSHGDLGTHRGRASPAYCFLFKPQPQLKSNGYIEVIRYWALYSTQWSDNNILSVSHFIL